MPLIELMSEQEIREACVNAHNDGVSGAFVPYIFRNGLPDFRSRINNVSDETLQAYNNQCRLFEAIRNSYSTLDYQRAITLLVLARFSMQGFAPLDISKVCVRNSKMMIGFRRFQTSQTMVEHQNPVMVGDGQIIPPRQFNLMLFGEYEWMQPRKNLLNLFHTVYNDFQRLNLTIEQLPQVYKMMDFEFQFNPTALESRLSTITSNYSMLDGVNGVNGVNSHIVEDSAPVLRFHTNPSARWAYFSPEVGNEPERETEPESEPVPMPPSTPSNDDGDLPLRFRTT